MMGRAWLQGIAMGAALLFLALMPAKGEAQEKVVFGMDWIIYGKHAAFYVALEKGYYREVGFDTQIVRGHGSGADPGTLSAGGTDFHFLDTPSLVIGRSKGMKVKQTAIYHAKNLDVIYTIQGKGIERPKDLEGRTIGCPSASGPRILFPIFAKANGIDAAKVRWEEVAGPAQIPSVMAGKVDAICTYDTIYPNILEPAQKEGKKVIKFLYPELGMDIYSGGIATQDQRIREKPGQVRRFVLASIRGIDFGIKDPKAAIEFFSKHHPAVSPAMARAHWDIAVRHMIDDAIRKNGLGYMTEERMRHTRDVVTEAFKLAVVVPVGDLYTNEFLPGIKP